MRLRVRETTRGWQPLRSETAETTGLHGTAGGLLPHQAMVETRYATWCPSVRAGCESSAT